MKYDLDNDVDLTHRMWDVPEEPRVAAIRSLEELIGKTIVRATIISHDNGASYDEVIITADDGVQVRLVTSDSDGFESWIESPENGRVTS